MSDACRIKLSAHYDRIVAVMEELVQFTMPMGAHAAQLVDSSR